MENRSAALPRRGFDVTSSAFLICRLSDRGIAGALQTPTLSLFRPTGARPPGDGRFLFTGSAVIGILVSQFLAGRSDRQGDRKQLIVASAVCWGCWPAYSLPGTATISFCCSSAFFLSSFGSTANPQMFALALGACRQDRPRSGDVQLHFTCPGLPGMGYWSPAGLRPGDGIWFYHAMYLSAAARLSSAGSWSGYSCPACAKQSR